MASCTLPILRPFPSSALVLLGLAVPASATPGDPPAIASDAPEPLVFFLEDRPGFTLTVTEPDGDPVDLVCLNPPADLEFQPVVGGKGPFSCLVRWGARTGPDHGGSYPLVFEARDVDGTTRLTVRALIYGDRSMNETRSRAADLSGDGRMDFVSLATQATVGGVSNAGAVYYWEGGPSPSVGADATLADQGATLVDQLGLTSGDPLQVGDVTGDGIDDLVVASSASDQSGVSNAGAVYLWRGAGSLAGDEEPTAVLVVPGATAGDSLSRAGGQGVFLADVTGDGVDDVLVGCHACTVAGAPQAGAVFVWAGGPTLSGFVAPTATLVDPDPVAFDRLAGSSTSSEQHFQVGDVNGDGVFDVLASNSNMDYQGVVDAGLILMWSGGGELVGTPPPTATLAIPSASAGDGLGIFRLGDVSGDGVADVVGLAVDADVNGVVDAGGIWVWHGRAAFQGTLDSSAALFVSNAQFNDALGAFSVARPLFLRDVTGDGVLDVVSGTLFADVGGVIDAGAVYFWKGGNTLLGPTAETASLYPPAGPAGLRFADVTGDGQEDFVVPSLQRLEVWAGGPALTGAPAPLATLVTTDNVLGRHVGDVTGDGVADIVAALSFADIAGVTNAGVIELWAGGPGLSGMPAPTTLAQPVLRSRDRLGEYLRLGDVTGDGILDVVAGVGSLFSPTGTGYVLLWAGGTELVSGTPAPTSTLRIPSGPRLASVPRELDLGDVTGDGVLDVVAANGYAVVNGVESRGALFLWEGGGEILGNPLPAVLLVPQAKEDDRYGETDVVLADANADGVLDVTAVSALADLGAVDTGAAPLWVGPSFVPLGPGAGQLLGSEGAEAGPLASPLVDFLPFVSPSALRHVPGASAGSKLGGL